MLRVDAIFAFFSRLRDFCGDFFAICPPKKNCVNTKNIPILHQNISSCPSQANSRFTVWREVSNGVRINSQLPHACEQCLGVFEVRSISMGSHLRSSYVRDEFYRVSTSNGSGKLRKHCAFGACSLRKFPSPPGDFFRNFRHQINLILPPPNLR